MKKRVNTSTTAGTASNDANSDQTPRDMTSDPKRSLTLLEAVFQAMADGVVVFDMAGNAVLINQAEARICGYENVEEMKRNLAYFGSTFVLRNPDRSILPMDQWPVSRVLRGESVVNVELWGQRLDTGREWFFNFSGEPVRDEHGRQALALIVTRDITAGKRTEEVLRTSEARLRAIFGSLVEGVVFLNPQGEVEQANDALQRIHGHTLQELTGPKLDPRLRIVRPDGTPFPVDEQPAIVALRTGKPVYDVEMGVQTTDGSLRWRLVNAQPVRDDRGAILGAVASFYDISKLKQAERETRERESRLRLFIEHAPAPIAMLDRNMRYLAFSRRWMSDYQIGDRDITGLSHYDVFPEIPEKWKAVHQRCLAGASEKCEEDSFLRADGRTDWLRWEIYPWYDSSGGIGGIIIFSELITDRKKAERERAGMFEVLQLLNKAVDQKQLLKSILNFLKTFSGCEAVAIRIKDGTDFPYSQTSGFPEEFVRLESHLCSYDENGAVKLDADGKPIVECMCGNILRGRFDHSKSFFTTDGSFWSNCTTDLLATTTDADRQTRTRNRCNASGYESVALVPLRSGTETFGLLQFNDKQKGRFTTETIASYRWIADNIANFLAKKQAEEALRKLNIELEQRVADRTAQLEAVNKELESFSYSVSHDLRAPLRAIAGFSKMILEDYGDRFDGECGRLFNVIKDNTLKMGDLIDDLLAFSRLGRQEIRKVDVDTAELVAQVLASVRDAPENKGRTVEARVGSLPNIFGDPNLIRQALVNLISNAFKYTRPREKAVIEIGCDKETFFIRDNGVGFNMRYADRLFGVFQRLHSVADFEGTGIGLALVKRIIMRHGGKVWAEGEPDKGATFFFTLPADK